jgi:putative NADH-flavin reductase
MKILILGATGRTGKHLVTSALQKGYEVTCLVRSPEKVAQAKGLTILKGDPINIQDLELAMKDCDAVFSALNISRTSDFPWAKLRTPKTYLSDVMANVITVAKKFSVNRVVICSAWGVLETRKDIPFWFRWTIDFSNISVAYKDHERQEKLLETSNLNWTIVRPVGLINTQHLQSVKETFQNRPKPSLLIGRSSVANYMIESIENEELFGQKVVISKA